jgi:Skp family chaperone for outer membrane proteins
VFVRKFVSRTALAAVTDAPALTSVSATNAAAAPTQAEFNAFVTEFNKLRTDLDATRGQLNTALARLRSQKLITT